MVIAKALNQLFEVGKKEIVISNAACGAIGVGSFIILIALGAFVRIPLLFTPVPITLQTFFVLLSGSVMGRKLGVVSCAGYLLLGAIGLPIFAGASGGAVHLIGATGGYLVGFVVASWTAGKLIHSKLHEMVNTSVSRSNGRLDLFWIIMAMTVASSIIYLLGALWLSLSGGIGIKKAIIIGVLPFIPGDGVKLFVAAFLYRKFHKRFEAIFPD